MIINKPIPTYTLTVTKDELEEIRHALYVTMKDYQYRASKEDECGNHDIGYTYREARDIVEAIWKQIADNM